MKPCAVLVGVGWSIEERDLALIPALVGLLDVGEIERGESIRRVRWNSWDAALIAVAAVCRVAVVPYIDRDFLTLDNRTQEIITTASNTALPDSWMSWVFSPTVKRWEDCSAQQGLIRLTQYNNLPTCKLILLIVTTKIHW